MDDARHTATTHMCLLMLSPHVVSWSNQPEEEEEAEADGEAEWPPDQTNQPTNQPSLD